MQEIQAMLSQRRSSSENQFRFPFAMDSGDNVGHHGPVDVHTLAGLQGGGDVIQLTCKIVDPEMNGGMRYKAWTHHREVVLQRLNGWQLVASGPDFATFNVPRAIVEAAATERQAKIPKEERRYWGDKSDFCRCLETVLNELEPKATSAPSPSSYLLFCQDKRQEHKEAGHTTPLDVKDLGAMWKALSEEERKPWTEKAEQLKASGATMGIPGRKRSKLKGSMGGNSAPIQPLPPAVQAVCSENGLDNLDVLVRLIEGKQPMELMMYERRLRVIMNRLHELQFQISTSMPAKKRQKVGHHSRGIMSINALGHPMGR
mmetsp:Transcript_7280/g.25052  ORF Transcript_7280/g.25052 Transcript_7280/m.25052 type:complete len:316 (-) Transcript_7280:981-1928(-)